MKTAGGARPEPVRGVWLSALEAFVAGRPEMTARRVLEAAARSHRGAQCASCGRVVRRWEEGAGPAFFTGTWNVDNDTCVVLACSQLCAVRLGRRGPCLEALSALSD